MKEWLGHITLSNECSEPMRILECFGTPVWNNAWQPGVVIDSSALLLRICELPGSDLGP
jgi:hypothetical protein